MLATAGRRTWTRALCKVAPIEATTYLVLVIGTVARIGFGGPNLSPILGPIHGAIFLCYFACAIEAKAENDWDLRRTVSILFAAVIPLGGFFVAERLIR